MTELSTDWTGAHGAGALRMSRSGPLTEGADVLRAVRVYMVQGLALGTPHDDGSGWQFRSVGDNNGVVAGSGLHNHPQSSGEHNMSRAHSRSTVTVQMDPYPFPPTCDPTYNLQTSLPEGTAQSHARSCQWTVHFSFHCLVTILFPGQYTTSRSANLYLRHFPFVSS